MEATIVGLPVLLLVATFYFADAWGRWYIAPAMPVVVLAATLTLLGLVEEPGNLNLISNGNLGNGVGLFALGLLPPAGMLIARAVARATRRGRKGMDGKGSQRLRQLAVGSVVMAGMGIFNITSQSLLVWDDLGAGHVPPLVWGAIAGSPFGQVLYHLRPGAAADSVFALGFLVVMFGIAVLLSRPGERSGWRYLFLVGLFPAVGGSVESVIEYAYWFPISRAYHSGGVIIFVGYWLLGVALAREASRRNEPSATPGSRPVLRIVSL